MNADLVVQFWLAVAGWFLVGWLLLFVWPQLAVAIARQRLFEIRDALFDCATAGKFKFDSPKYRLARDVINAKIRSADHTAFVRYALYYRAIKQHKIKLAGGPIQQLRDDPATPAAIKVALSDADRVTTALIAFRNPVASIVVGLGMVLLRIGKRIASTQKVAARTEQRVRARKAVAAEADVRAQLEAVAA